MNPFIIIAYLEDLTITSRLIKVCQQNNFELLLPDSGQKPDTDPERIGMILIDLDEPSFHTRESLDALRSNKQFPVVGMIEKIPLRSSHVSARIICDLIIPKSLLEQNLSVIIQQLKNGS